MKRRLQVFVSSTFTDLIEERQAAVSAILKAGHIPAGMELFTSGDQAQLAVIQRWIDESDVYMLILGGRYGSIEASANISYTELEFDYAKAAGKRCFSVVISEQALNEKVKVHGLKFVEQNNVSALSQFRLKVMSNLAGFFTDLKDIKLCVYESLSDFSTDPDLVGWVSAKFFEDTTILREQIKVLQTENQNLRRELDEQKESSSGSYDLVEVVSQDDVIQVLDSIEVSSPEHLIAALGASNSLLKILYLFRNQLIVGVQNKVAFHPTFRFLYFNVFPKLQAHSLAANEAVHGVRYRRSFLNPAGCNIAARLEREHRFADIDKALLFPAIKKLVGGEGEK